MSVQDVTQLSELQELCKKHKKVLVDFHATWCGPCKAIAPYVVQQCQAQGVHLVKVDVDQGPEISQKYEVSAMPTFKVLNTDGSPVFEKVGGGQANVNACLQHIANM